MLHQLITGRPLSALLLLSLLCGCSDSNNSNSSQGFDRISAQDIADNERHVATLNDDWSFGIDSGRDALDPGFDDAQWQTVELPHPWNAEDGADGGSGQTGDYLRGDGWYRKQFEMKASDSELRHFIQINGGGLITEVAINGTILGTHEGAFTAFRFDLSPYLSYGDSNTLTIRVNNERNENVAPLNGDFTIFGGLHRKVQMISVRPVYFELADHGSPGIYIKQSAVSTASATIDVVAHIANDSEASFEGQLATYILDHEGQVVGQNKQDIIVTEGKQALTGTLTLDNPRLWHGLQDPYLYQVLVRITDKDGVIDQQSQPLGIRSFSVDPQTGFHLNGEPYPLNGIALHHDRLGKGWAINEEDLDEDYQILMDMGTTAVRMAHYPHSEFAYQLADRLGLIVWAEIPLVNGVTNSPEFESSTRNQLKDMIRQNFNHPSIMFWGLFNEVTIESTEEEAAPLVTQLQNLAKREDPDRLTVGATVLLDPEANPNSPTNVPLDITAYNTYFGWYYSEVQDFGEWADDLHEQFPNTPLAVSEYGAGAGVSLHSSAPNNIDHSEEFQMLFHEGYWQQIEERDYLWGSFLWVMFDFASDARAEGEADGVNDKGLVTGDRKIRKDAYFWYQAQWSDNPMLYLTSKRYTDRRSGSTTIKAYSNLPQVHLYVNDVLIGTQYTEDGKAEWLDVALQLGDNRIRIEADNDGVLFSDDATWARSLNNETTLSSQRIGINARTGRIANRPYKSTLGDLKRLITVAEGATLSLADNLTAGDDHVLQDQDVIRVTAEDNTTVQDYRLVSGSLSLHRYADVNKEFGPDMTRENANDGLTAPGYMGFMWFSFGGTGWWKLVLGDDYYIDAVRSHWPQDEHGGGVTSYLVELSDTDVVFDAYYTVADRSDNTIPVMTYDEVGMQARFLRMRILDTTTVFPTTSIKASGAVEFEVFGGYISSDQIAIDYEDHSIHGVSGQTATAMLSSIIPAGSATVRLESATGQPVAPTDKVTAGMILVASSSDGLMREAYEVAN